MSGKMAEYMAVSLVTRASRGGVRIHARPDPWRRLLLPPPPPVCTLRHDARGLPERRGFSSLFLGPRNTMHAFEACTVAPHMIPSGPKRRTRTRRRPFFSQHIKFLSLEQEAVQGEGGGGAPCSLVPLPGRGKVVVAIQFICHFACMAPHLRARAQKRLKGTFFSRASLLSPPPSLLILLLPPHCCGNRSKIHVPPPSNPNSNPDMQTPPIFLRR
jgi:hypothetical protein